MRARRRSIAATTSCPASGSAAPPSSASTARRRSCRRAGVSWWIGSAGSCSRRVVADLDPVALEIAQHRLAGIAEEMGVVLGRTALSPNIKERRDYSCAIFDAAGGLAAQAAHIPVHLGSTPLAV